MKTLAAFLFLCACAPTDVIVAEVEAGPDGSHFRTCVGNQDCSPNEFCDRHSCSDVTGGCAPRPLMCDQGDSNPMCSCDGLNYWNDCVRKQNGISAATTGECETTATTCDDNTPCPNGSYCARIFGEGECDPDGGGACWVLPTNCPPSEPDAGMYQKCPNPTCSGLCDAIRSQQAYAAAPTCP
jgi:hypothetical protein